MKHIYDPLSTPFQHFQQTIHGFPQSRRAFLPIRNRLLEADRFGRAVAITISVVRPNVERDAEVIAFLPDFFIADHRGKALLVPESLVDRDNSLDVVVSEETLRPLTGGHLVYCVDKEHLVSVFLWLVHAADDNAGLHG
jgi:hypothetical protein